MLLPAAARSKDGPSGSGGDGYPAEKFFPLEEVPHQGPPGRGGLAAPADGATDRYHDGLEGLPGPRGRHFLEEELSLQRPSAGRARNGQSSQDPERLGGLAG